MTGKLHSQSICTYHSTTKTASRHVKRDSTALVLNSTCSSMHNCTCAGERILQMSGWMDKLRPQC